ncbi:MAG: ATP-binding protein [Ignavibacteriales bacterium]|nr:ATP-binding protein [Ignavibacteriales bacterium]
MFKKIGFKLTVAVGMTALVTISVFAYFNIRSDRRSLLAEMERHANQLSEVVKSSTEYDMLLNQRDRIHETIKRVGNRHDIKRIRVLNKSGEIIYSSDSTEIGKMVDKNAESCTKCHSADRPLERLEIKERMRIFQIHPDSSRMLGIINPIYNSRSCYESDCHVHSKDQLVLGVLDVTLPLSEVDKDIRRGQIEIIIFALSAILALSLIIGFFVTRWVDTPVKELLSATQHVAGGDLNYTIKEKREKLSDARMQLFQSDKLASLGRLAAGVAHEINNPLTGVLTYSSFLLKRTQDQPEIQEDLKVIVRETIRSREIVKSLLDFARQSVPKKSEADINEIANRALSVVESQLSLHHVKLVKTFSSDVPKVTVDANQLQQVFINLVVNASDAIGPEGGTITLSSTLLSLSPIGITQIKKAQCPKRHSLISADVRIDGKPSIRVKARSNGTEGFVYLDPMYGMKGHQHGISFDVKKGVQVMCPECSASLMVEHKPCPECSSPIFAFEVPSKGIVESCTRMECNWQHWEVVDASGQKEFVELKISDTGCGIAKDDLPKIFEPFYSTKGQKGNGLGLAVIWGIIDNHNGTIRVDSQVGAGTTFTIRIPVKP